MVKNIYAVHDIKANTYGQPFVMVNEQTAVRAFVRACNDPSSDIGAFYADHNLYFIGTFNDESGTIDPAKPFLVTSGSQSVATVSQS